MAFRFISNVFYRVLLWGSENFSQSLIKPLHGLLGIIGAHVDNHVFVAGSFFQHVCGNSEPVSAV